MPSLTISITEMPSEKKSYYSTAFGGYEVVYSIQAIYGSTTILSAYARTEDVFRIVKLAMRLSNDLQDAIDSAEAEYERVEERLNEQLDQIEALGGDRSHGRDISESERYTYIAELTELKAADAETEE